MLTSEQYAQTVEESITAQGLRPIMAALDAANIRYSVEQTGGFCMVGHTECVDGTLITWNADSVIVWESAWHEGQSLEPILVNDLDEYGNAYSAEDVVSMISNIVRNTHRKHDGYATHLWDAISNNTYRMERAMRNETMYRLNTAYSFRQSLADHYGAHVPSAEEYAESVADEYADFIGDDL